MFSRHLRIVVLCGLAACGGGDDTDPTVATCDDYCDEIQTNCGGAETQYTTRDQCLAACESFPQGEPGDRSGHSVECRAYLATASLGDPTVHCVHAGPGGDDTCGENCQGFCAIVLATCTGDNEVYSNEEECLDECGNFADTESFDVSDVSGNTLACRIYHASVATSDPDTHCAHTRPDSITCQ